MNRTRRWISAALFTSLITVHVFAVEVNVNIKGCITDQKSKEPLIGATVQIVGSNIGAVTNSKGNAATATSISATNNISSTLSGKELNEGDASYENVKVVNGNTGADQSAFSWTGYQF